MDETVVAAMELFLLFMHRFLRGRDFLFFIGFWFVLKLFFYYLNLVIDLCLVHILIRSLIKSYYQIYTIHLPV